MLDEQHISPTMGLCVHELERQAPRDLALSRLSVDILGPVRIEPVEVEVTVLRPGRTIELAEVVVTQAGRAVVRARAWRLSTQDTSAVAGGTGPTLPDPATATPWPMAELWPGGYIGSLDVRSVAAPPSGPAPGRATAWVSTDVVLVEDEPVSDVAAFVALVDTANGIAVRRLPHEWMFPNVDLTLHLHRRPTGRWVGLDTSVVFGPDGTGLTSTVLHDLAGPVGRAEQILTVRPLA